MNGLLTRLNIIRNNILVKKGQVIYNHTDQGNIASMEGCDLPEGMYYVKSAELKKKLSEGKTKYMHDLDLIRFNLDDEGEYSRSNKMYSVSVDLDTMCKNFGISKNAKKGQLIYEYIKDQFNKAGKPEYFNPNLDYDRDLNKIAWSLMDKSSIKFDKTDGEDIISEALLHLPDQNAFKKYDPKQDLMKFLIFLFYRKIGDEIRKYAREYYRVQHDDEHSDMSEETYMDIKAPKDKIEGPSSHMEYKELLNQLVKFMKNRTRGSQQVTTFALMLKENSKGEIADKMKISPALVSRYVNDIKDSMVEYAKKSGNDTLLALIQHHSRNRTHADEESNYLMNALSEYKKKYGAENNGHEIVGKVLKIKKTTLVDKVSDEAIAQAVLSDSSSAASLKRDIGEYLSLLDSQDELIDCENGRIVGLKIVSDDVRNIESECDKNKK